MKYELLLIENVSILVINMDYMIYIWTEYVISNFSINLKLS